ncbi:hypothetical protein YC2023_037791 [Brassica napus]
MTVARDNAIAGILDGKIYVVGGFSIYESKNWAEVYDTKTQTWESLPDPGVQLRSLYYNEKHNCWTRVNGLSVLERHCRGNIEMANYGGKLLMIWEKVVHTCHCYDEKNIWCALIAFEIRNGDEEVWGKVEWANSVLTVPISCNFTSHQQDGYHNYRKAYELLPPSTAKHSYTDGDVNLEKASWGRQNHSLNLTHHLEAIVLTCKFPLSTNSSEALASSASSEGRTYNSSNRRPGIRHSTFESLHLGLSSQSIASGFLRFWDSLNFKKHREFVRIAVLFLDEKVNSVIHGFTPVGRANHYMPSLKADSIVKVDRFEVARCSK